MEEINHFSHKSHPLKLVNLETIVGTCFHDHGGEKPRVFNCYACKKPISSGFVYGCIQCCHLMHKACAQLPFSINHPSLYEHPLTLFDFGNTENPIWSCHVCRIQNKIGGFCYFYAQHEYGVNFRACIDCCIVEIALKEEADTIKGEARIKILHEGHQNHTLTLQSRPAAFHCDACKTRDDGLFYQCESCDFWIHKSCASLAPTIHLPDHHNHPLVLVYSFPEKFFKFAYYCEFCGIYIRRNDWLYHCANCRYFAHIKCILNVEQPSIQRDGPSTSAVDEDENGLLHFPMSNEFTDPLKLQHYEKMTQDDDDEKNLIEHWSHEHPLILHVQPQANNMFGCSDAIEVCFGCVRPLSYPYYSCKDGCLFTFHKYCAELPLKLQHPLHPNHSLFLINNLHYQCEGCYSYGNTFLYRCESCKFYLDVNCAFLPRTIKHKSHKHPLIQVIDPKPLCNACNMWYDGISYGCKACSFTLDMYCAVRSPDSLGHRYCKGHEIPLTYPPVMDHPEDFYCDICEEEMHPKLPLYYCGKCKNSFHLYCISQIDYYANIFHEGTLNVSYHKHPLTFFRRKKTPKYVCSICNQDINGRLILECRGRVCGFNICYLCHLRK